MNEKERRIRDTIIRKAVTDWLDQDNPFSDFVFEQNLIPEIAEELGEDVDRNDVEYVWKRLTEKGYFRKRGNSRRITAKEIEEAEKSGVETPLNDDVQEAILQLLKEAEREDVSNPQVSRDDLINQLENYDAREIDYNLFYCRSKGWVEVGVYISEDPWQHAEITRFGREMAAA